MRRLRLAFGSAVCLAATFAYACGSGSHPSAIGDSDAAPPSDDGSRTIDGRIIDANPTASDAPLGQLPTVDEPDVPCVQAGGTRVTLFSNADSGGNGSPAIAHLQALRALRLGTGDNLPGFATFDAIGQNAQVFDMSPGTVQTSFASEGDTIGAMIANAATIEYQRFDAQGAALGGRVSLRTGLVPSPIAIWIAAGGGGSLGVWEAGKTLSAAGITAAGASAGPAWQLSNDGVAASVSIAYVGGKYAILWSVQPTSQSNLTRFVLADPSGISGAPVEIASGGLQFSVIKLLPTPIGFLAVLLGAGGDNHVYTVPLDASGNVSGTAHRLLGADYPWDIALQGNEVGLVTSGNDILVDGSEGPRKPLFRPLDLTGHPIGPWVCLDGFVPTGQYQDMALLQEANGYALVYKTPADDTVLVKFDHLGTGAP